MNNGFSNALTRSFVTGSLAVAALATSATASAGSISYDFRADYQNLSYTSDLVPNSSRFFLKTGRLDFKGNLNESLSYQARWAFNKPAASTVSATAPAGGGSVTGSSVSNQSRDALNNSVELAYLTHKMTDTFALSVGKFNTEIGGFEAATSGADLYLVSPMYSRAGAANTTGTGPLSAGTLRGQNLGTNASNPNLLYMTGVKATVGIAEGHSLALMATNNTTDPVDSGSNFNQNRGLLGATYKAAFMEKTLMSVLSYHEVTTQTTLAGAAGHGKHSFISAGLKYDAAPWAAMFEYQTTEFKDDATGNKDNLSGFVARLAHTINEQWTPRLEAFTAEERREVGTSETNRFVGVGGVLEYKPTADNFRYHIAYNTITNQPATGSEVSRTEIVVGARLLGDFLK